MQGELVMYTPRRVLKGMYWLLGGNPAQRRRSRQECARLAAALFGDFPLSDDYKLWRTDTTFLEDYQRLSPGNPYSQDRKYLLREFLRFTRNVPGVLAECGCYAGASAYFMAQVMPELPLHLFDSFEGISLPQAFDKPVGQDHLLWQAGDMCATEEQVRRNLKDFGNVQLHKGWIPERFVDVADQIFRLVHIDVDLYQPTLDSLQFFYPRMARGGVIVMDDYGFTTCPGAYRAATEFMAGKAEYIVHMPTGQGVIIIGS
jgi:predicted O-methyltransferase YrrM